MSLTFIFYLSFSLLLLFILSVTVLACGYYWTVVRKCRGFPIYPLIPNLARFLLTREKSQDFSEFLFQSFDDMYKKHAKEGLCMTYSLFPSLYLFGEEPVKLFLNHKAAMDKIFEYKFLKDVIGSGLVTSNGERWKKHRKMISPAFQIGMLKEKIPLFNEHASSLVEDLRKLENKPSTDVLMFIKHHYFNALSESVFGVKQTKENEETILRYFELLDRLGSMTSEIAFQPWIQWKFLLNLLPSGKMYQALQDELCSISKNILIEMKKHVALNKESDSTGYFNQNLQKSFSYILLQHHMKDPSFTFDDMHAEVRTFMSAGYDTVSYSTIWCLFMLALYPEIQEKAFQEVQSDSHSFVSFEDLCSFTYLEAVIMETLRLYPTIAIIGRHLKEDVQCGKYKVPRGTNLVFSLYHCHRNPDIYPDPEKFDPERFLGTDKVKSLLHIPFAEGTRMCIGKKYSLIEMKIFLAHILRNFKITSLDKREDVKLCWNIVTVPEKPLRLLITPR